MRDVAAHRAKRGPFNTLQLQGEGGDGVALDGGQNARRWYYDRGWRRGYQNTGWGHGPVTCATSVAVSVIGERKSIPSKYAKRQQADELFVPHADLPWAGLARLLQAGAILRHSNRRYDAAKEYCTPVK